MGERKGGYDVREDGSDCIWFWSYSTNTDLPSPFLLLSLSFLILRQPDVNFDV